jgi:hypothetical protein
VSDIGPGPGIDNGAVTARIWLLRWRRRQQRQAQRAIQSMRGGGIVAGGAGHPVVLPLAVHTASQPAGGVARAQGVSMLTSSTQNHAPSTQRARRAAGWCRGGCARQCMERL